jgi:serine/threonine protein phosphatase PrpC
VTPAAASPDDTLPDRPPGSSPTAPPAVRSGGRTDRGLVREANEDHFLIAELARTLWVHQTSLPQPATRHGFHRGHLLLVADGMGGHLAGEVASALSVAFVEDYVLQLLKRLFNLRAADEQTVLRDFQAALREADERLFAEAEQHPEFAGMGTTLTLAYTSGWRLFVAHAGDSRCYLARGGRLWQLTEDHTAVAELARRGAISPQEAARSPYRHVVTNVLGGGTAGVRADVSRTDLCPGDAVLLCTDGLTDLLDDGRLAEILAAEGDPQAACGRLVAAANAAGGRDNVTAVVARFDAA